MSAKSPDDRDVKDPEHPVIVLAGGGIGPIVSREEGGCLLDAITVDGESADWAESPLITAEQVVALLHISSGELSLWLEEKKVIAFKMEAGGDIFPVRQFDEGRPVAGLDLVAALFSSAEEAWEWLLAPNRITDGATPLEWLRCGDVAVVVGAAQGALDYA